MSVNPIPENHPQVTPYLTVSGVAGLLQFLKDVFDAEETHRMDGSIMHAEVTIGNGAVMMGEPRGEWKAVPGAVFVYVADCDAVYQKGLASGGVSLMEPTDQFHGDRYGGGADPFGNQWWIASRIEEVSTEEMIRREAEFKKKMGM